MVIDTLDNLEHYVSLNPLFADVVAFLKANDLKTLDEGKHAIKGADLFVNIQTKQGKTRDDAVLEYHRRMIDIQIPLNAAETYGYAPVATLPAADFNEEKDIAKLHGAPSESYVTCQPGEFAIFFPQDGHAPCIGEGDIHKAIFKIKA